MTKQTSVPLKSSNNSIKYIIIGIVCVSLGIGLISFLWMYKSDNPTNNNLISRNNSDQLLSKIDKDKYSFYYPSNFKLINNDYASRKTFFYSFSSYTDIDKGIGISLDIVPQDERTEEATVEYCQSYANLFASQGFTIKNIQTISNNLYSGCEITNSQFSADQGDTVRVHGKHLWYKSGTDLNEYIVNGMYLENKNRPDGERIDLAVSKFDLK